MHRDEIAVQDVADQGAALSGREPPQAKGWMCEEVRCHGVSIVRSAPVTGGLRWTPLIIGKILFAREKSDKSYSDLEASSFGEENHMEVLTCKTVKNRAFQRVADLSQSATPVA
jgi:hypothetical protein